MDDEVIVFLRDKGEYYEHDRLLMSSLKNILPSFGDRLTLHIGDSGLGTYEVVARYHSTVFDDDRAPYYFHYWVLVVEQIHFAELFKLDAAIRQIHADDLQAIAARQPRDFSTITARRPAPAPKPVYRKTPKAEKTRMGPITPEELAVATVRREKQLAKQSRGAKRHKGDDQR